MSEHLKAARGWLGLSDSDTAIRLNQARAALWKILDHLEAQEAAAPSPTTASPTTEAPSAADSAPPTPPMETGSTTQTTPLLQRLHGTLTLAELGHVARCSSCMDQLVAFESALSMHVPAVATPATPASPTSTYPNSATASSAASPQADAPSPTGSSGKLCWLCEERPRAHNQILCRGCLDDSVNEMHRSGIEALTDPRSSKWQVYHATTCPRHLRGTHFTKASDCTCGLDEWLAVKDGVRDTPARSQWPEPKPGEEAWKVGSAGLLAPDGEWWSAYKTNHYLNALYRGEVGPRDRWPS